MNHYITGFLSCLALSWVQKCQLFHFEGFFRKQERIPVECVPPASVAATRCQYWGGVWNHSLSRGGLCLWGVSRRCVSGGCPGGLFRGCTMSPIPSCIWCYLYAVPTPTESQHKCICLYSARWSCDPWNAYWVIHTPCGQTGPCKNITFPQLLLQVVKIQGWYPPFGLGPL